MEVPKYLQVLWSGKWLLLVGIIVASAAGFFAGYTIQDGEIVPRAEQSYTASTTVMISSQTQPLFNAVLPGQELVEGQTQPTDVDLTSKAIIYAYLVSGQDTRTAVESQIGEFDETEVLRSVRRTTQPGGDEAFPGRYSLPIIDVIGVSNDPDRAQAISDTATADFMAQVTADQDAQQLAPEDRVLLDVLDVSAPKAVEGSNPMIPVVVAFLGVFLLFVAAAFIIAGARSSRAAKRARAAEAAGVPADDADVDQILGETTMPRSEPVVRRSGQRRARTAVSDGELSADSEEREHAPVG